MAPGLMIMLPYISTHTPTQGVTRYPANAEDLINHFYSHAHAGRDDGDYSQLEQVSNFYSHAHAGRDIWACVI